MRHVLVGGMPAAVASRRDLADALIEDCRARGLDPSRRPRLVFDINGQGLSLFWTDPAYRGAIEAADIVHADGAFIVWMAAALTDARIPERSATTDMIYDIAARCAEEGLSFYLLGGTEEVNARCAQVLVERYPGLRIAGRRNGFFGASEEASVLAEIARAKPDVLWVGLGKPKEQLFAALWRDRFEAGWVVTCGGCFNFVVGHYTRAPRWMQAVGLEWAHRMATGPSGIAWRYLTTNPHALWLALTRTRRRPFEKVFP